MSNFWRPTAAATPVQGWGVVTLDPARRYAEVVTVLAHRSLALGSLTFSEAPLPDPNSIVTVQLETARPGHQGQPGGAMPQFYQLTLQPGTSQHLAFPCL